MSWLSNAMFGKKKNVETDFSQLGVLGNEYLNPFSSKNKSMLSGFTNQATDIIAQQGLNNQKLGAIGINPFSNQQNNNLVSNVIKNAGGGWNEWISNASNIGTGLLQNKYNMEFQKDMFNANIYNQRQSQISGFMQGLLGQATSAFSAPMGNLAGSFMNFLI